MADGVVKQVVFNFPQPKHGLTSVLPDPLVVTVGSEAAEEAAPVPAAAAAPGAAAPCLRQPQQAAFETGAAEPLQDDL